MVKGGSKSRFTENKLALSECTGNNITKITAHDELHTSFSFTENYFGSQLQMKSRFTRKQKTKKHSHFTFRGKKKRPLRKIPFTTLDIDKGRKMYILFLWVRTNMF